MNDKQLVYLSIALSAVAVYLSLQSSAQNKKLIEKAEKAEKQNEAILGTTQKIVQN